MATATLAAVLLAAILLGVEVWVVGIAALAWTVSRPTLTGVVVATAGAALVASAVGYVTVVILVGRWVAP
jgi:hypothetical protein